MINTTHHILIMSRFESSSSLHLEEFLKGIPRNLGNHWEELSRPTVDYSTSLNIKIKDKSTSGVK